MPGFFFFITVILILSGCSHTMRNPYPAWPPITTDLSKDSIAAITGKFHARAEPDQQLNGYSASLLSFLTEDNVLINNLTGVSIQEETDKKNHYLKIQGLQNGSVVYELVLKKDEDFKISGEGIQIFRDWHFVNINFGLAWEKNYYTFSRATDGSLILKNHTFSKGLYFFIIPVVSEETVWWWRWHPY